MRGDYLVNNYVDIAMLPDSFSRAYKLYILSQRDNIEKVAERTVGTEESATIEKLRNDVQDGQIDTLNADVAALQGGSTSDRAAVTALGKDLESIRADYISKTQEGTQLVAGELGCAKHFRVDKETVLGPREKGFTPPTGTPYYGPFDADLSIDKDNVHQELASTRKRLAAIEKALASHGLIGE